MNEKQNYINAVEENLKKLRLDDFKRKDILEIILKDQRDKLFKYYNVYNMDTDRDEFTIQKCGTLKTLVEIETEIKNYFSQYNKDSKIKELVQKIGLFYFGKYDAPKNKKHLFDDCTFIIELQKGEIVFRMFWDKLKNYGNGMEYSLTGSMDILRNIEQLFKLAVDIDLNFNAEYGYKPFYKQPLSEWQNTNGFKYKAYLNGKFKIQGDEKYLKPIKELYKDRYNTYDHIKIIEK